ncbi:helix-hairpin-helix domain-containing protein [Phycisphaeraceae bacterium D3-23]
MIASVTGTLTDLLGETAYLDPGHGLVYEVLLPAFAAHRLAVSVGQPVTLHTLHFMESNNQGATYLPRLAGFLSVDDRAFYELFVTCKGIGHKRALRAMVLPTHQLALAIADRDVKTLQTMPEVGKKTAETIAVTLRDKVERFITPGSGAAGTTDADTGDDSGGVAGDVAAARRDRGVVTTGRAARSGSGVDRRGVVAGRPADGGRSACRGGVPDQGRGVGQGF